MILPRSLTTWNIQPSLVRKANGNLVAFMRARGDVRLIRRAESSDGGMTWVDDPLDINSKDSSVAVVGLNNGHWILAVNDRSGRAVLTVHLSDDEGRTWKWKRSLEEFIPRQGSGQYPTLIQAVDGTIHIVYTHTDVARFGNDKMRTIKHVRFNEAWVQEGDLNP